MRRLGIGWWLFMVGAFLAPAGLASAEGLTDAVHGGRIKVVAVNHGAREIRSVNGTDEVRVDHVAQGVLVVADGVRRSDLAFVGIGDIVKAERRDGQIYRITVLRRAWRELGNPE